MPISFIRESIEQPEITVNSDLTIVQKRSNLGVVPGMKFLLATFTKTP